MRRRMLTVSVIVAGLMTLPSVAWACGGLIAPNGAVNLLRTTTLAAYSGGVEHYITSFEFTGARSGEFGSIVPLPDLPTKVEKAGNWTLQRLIREVAPPVPAAAEFAATVTDAKSARVILETKVDALDITVLEGGADEVATWADAHGFALSDDAPAALRFYADRSPYFMAARFDAARAASLGQGAGDGTPIQVTIPTDNPWVPLRILSLAKGADARVEADLFLLTDHSPAMLPAPTGSISAARFPIATGLTLERSEPAPRLLLDDLRSDERMEWIPTSAWFSHIVMDARAGDLTYDLAIDATGTATPSWSRAGLAGLRDATRSDGSAWLATLLALVAVIALMRSRARGALGR